MGLIFNRGGGKIGKGLDLLQEVAEIGKEAVTDRDKLNDLQYKIMETRAALLLSGKGSSVTKYTICFLVSLVVGCLCYAFMFKSNLIQYATQFSNAAFPYVAILIGGYAGGSTAKRFIEKGKKNE